jgi:hypothetical protein
MNPKRFGRQPVRLLIVVTVAVAERLRRHLHRRGHRLFELRHLRFVHQTRPDGLQDRIELLRHDRQRRIEDQLRDVNQWRFHIISPA